MVTVLTSASNISSGAEFGLYNQTVVVRQPPQALSLEVFASSLLAFRRTPLVFTTPQMDPTHVFVPATVLSRSHCCDVF